MAELEVVGDDEAIEAENKNDRVELVEAENEEDKERGNSRSKRFSKRFIKGGRKGNAVDGDDEYFEKSGAGRFQRARPKIHQDQRGEKGCGRKGRKGVRVPSPNER